MKSTRRLHYFAFYLLICPLAACTWHDPYYRILVQSDFQSEGFISSDLFQIKAKGESYSFASSIEQRRKESMQNALANALEKATDRVINDKLSAKQKSNPGWRIILDERSLFETRATIKNYFIGGQIVLKTFFSDGSCNIVYRVQKTNLRKLIENITLSTKLANQE